MQTHFLRAWKSGFGLDQADGRKIFNLPLRACCVGEGGTALEDGKLATRQGVGADEDVSFTEGCWRLLQENHAQGVGFGREVGDF